MTGPVEGVIFDIEEFAVFDGPGIRGCVFVKGCPLRCAWCHNPEGLKRDIQRAVTRSMCIGCGACEEVCPSPGGCTACGACVNVCPKGCISMVGERTDSARVARTIGAHADILRASGGGVTFSGGEPMAQSGFIVDIRRRLGGLHALIETSGYAPPGVFARVIAEMDMVIMDIKHMDDDAHRRYTGVSNEGIQRNLSTLKSSGIPFRIRVPLIPAVNDSAENMRSTAAALEGARSLEKVELLRYNRAAGGKYPMLDLNYSPPFPEDAEPSIFTEPFTDMGIEVCVL